MSGHTLRVCKVGQIIFLTGAVLRQVGGYTSNIATLPEEYWPSTTQFIGAGVSNRGTHYELYITDKGKVSIESYENIGSGAGMNLPIACAFILV